MVKVETVCRSLFSSYKNGYLVIQGQSSEAYHSSLQLDSVFRNLILLDEEVGVVVDSIETKDTSSITHVSTLFNNVVNTFYPYQHMLYSKVLQGFKVVLDDVKSLQAVWITKEGLSPRANISTLRYKSQNRMLSVSNVNVSSKITNNQAETTYIFFSNNVNLKQLHLNGNDSTELLLTIINDQNTELTFNIEISEKDSKVRIRTIKHFYHNNTKWEHFLFWLTLLFFIGVGFYKPVTKLAANKFTCRTRKALLQGVTLAMYISWFPLLLHSSLTVGSTNIEV